DSKTSITGLKTIFSAVSKERKGVKTKEYKELPTLEETLGVKTVVDPLAPVGRENGVETTPDPEAPVSPAALPDENGVKTDPDMMAPQRASKSGVETVNLDAGTPVAEKHSSGKTENLDVQEETSLSASLIQSITTLHDRNREARATENETTAKPVLKKIENEEAEVKDFIKKLGDSARVVNKDTGKNRNRMQLEVNKDGEWIQVMAYELSDSNSVRFEYSLKGKKPKLIKMDLPAAAMKEMAQNDISNNWEEYCKKFLAGKKITA
ncbi:MAG TPA: hypothetical protein PKC98_16350, partial [Candidatus Melainabacteria bacterium]|nr:hypothetical protein [Candidatus Melainabacteria bacterium]